MVQLRKLAAAVALATAGAMSAGAAHAQISGGVSARSGSRTAS